MEAEVEMEGKGKGEEEGRGGRGTGGVGARCGVRKAVSACGIGWSPGRAKFRD